MKTKIFNFNKSRSKEKYKEIFFENFTFENKCRECNDVIYYYDSTFIFGKDNTWKLKGKSCLSVKKIDREYNLTICEECLQKVFSEFENMNKSRVFNKLGYITEYAFSRYHMMSPRIGEKANVGITKDNFIRKYGIEEGEIRWVNYCEKQSVKNKYEYKKQKYGWDEEKFKEFNKSRSITLELMVKRHGENLGLIKWEEYINKQKITKSKDFVIKKYGEDFWNKLCKSKSHTIETYLDKYKDINLANQKLNEFFEKLKTPSIVSKSSQIYFQKLDEILGTKYKTYYYNKNGKEYGKNIGKRWVYLDYFIEDLNVCVEYNGDLFHGNPEFFGPEDEPIPFNKIKAKDIWEKDQEKIKLLNEKYNIRTIVIWESNLPSIDKIISEIEKYAT